MVPAEEGEYLYDVFVDWGKGDNNISYWLKKWCEEISRIHVLLIELGKKIIDKRSEPIERYNAHVVYLKKRAL